MTDFNDDIFCRRTFLLIQKGDDNVYIVSIIIIIKEKQKVQWKISPSSTHIFQV